MAEVAIVINGRTYQLACEDGQEDHLVDLSRVVEGHVREIVREAGQIGDARLILMAALIVADEAHELRRDVESQEGDTGTGAAAEVSEARLREAAETAQRETEEMLAASIEALTERLEHIAVAIEPA